MKIVFRTDSSYQIGSGHLMRCLTLAQALKKSGAEVSFVCRDLPGNSLSILEKNSFDFYVLPYSEWDKQDVDLTLYQKWLGEDWGIDAEQTKDICESMGKVDWLIVDSYSLDKQWECSARPCVKKIMVIDDIANREHNCDLLLDQNLYENMDARYKDLVPAECIQLLGPSYALLRDEFHVTKDAAVVRDKGVKRILVFFGGVDAAGLTLKVINSIHSLTLEGVVVDVVVGAANPNKHNIEIYCNKFSNMNYYCQIGNMAELMVNADLAIGAGGSTTWERCFLGLPTFVIPIADNQLESVRILDKYGIIVASKNWDEDLFFSLVRNHLKIENMSRSCFQQMSNWEIETVVEILKGESLNA